MNGLGLFGYGNKAWTQILEFSITKLQLTASLLRVSAWSLHDRDLLARPRFFISLDLE